MGDILCSLKLTTFVTMVTAKKARFCVVVKATRNGMHRVQLVKIKKNDVA